MAYNVKRLLIAVLITLTFFFTISCEKKDHQTGNTGTILKDKKSTVTIKITRDETKTVLSEKEIPFKKGLTAMDVTVLNYEVETAYGGGFVVAIDGLKSQTKAGEKQGHDWFYGVNGEEPTVGAADYMLKEGDVITWNFRKWSMESITKQFEEKKE